MYTETKSQAYEHFRRIFKEQPELLESTRPESLPATITVLPTDRAKVRELADHVRTQFPEVTKVEPVIRDEIAKKMSVEPGPCPDSGELPS